MLNFRKIFLCLLIFSIFTPPVLHRTNLKLAFSNYELTFEDLENKHTIWKDALKILAIPRCFKKENAAAEIIIEELQGLNFEVLAEGSIENAKTKPGFVGAVAVDAIGNVIAFYDPKGVRNQKAILLTSHLDMVCAPENRDWSQPIELYLDKENDGKYYLKAKGSSLGADDGVGVATMLWLIKELFNKKIDDICIEMAFTVDEEFGMSGAKNLDMSQFRANKIITLDNMTIFEIIIGSAGVAGISVKETAKENLMSIEQVDGTYIKIEIGGGQGGHSGIDIDKGRVNAIKLLIDLIHLIKTEYGQDVGIVYVNGGESAKSIPSRAYAILKLTGNKDEMKTDEMKTQIKYKIILVLESINREVEPNLKIEMEILQELPDNVKELENINFSSNAVESLIKRLYAVDTTDVLSYIDGRPETCLNLGKIKGTKKSAYANFMERSLNFEHLKEIPTEFKDSMLAVKTEGANVQIDTWFGFAPWTPQDNSELTGMVKKAALKVKDKKDSVVTTTMLGGLELTFFTHEKTNFYGQPFEAVDIGPTIYNTHTIDERLEVESMEEFTRWLWQIIKEFKKK